MSRNSLSGLCQAKPNVKWLLEFIQRGQRENKNITRELQLQPSNMTSVCFCASDWGPTFNGRFWLQDKQTVRGLTQPPSTSADPPQPAKQSVELNLCRSSSRSSGGFGGSVNYSTEQSCGLYIAYSHTHLLFLSLIFSLSHTHDHDPLSSLWSLEKSTDISRLEAWICTWSHSGGFLPQVSPRQGQQ